MTPKTKNATIILLTSAILTLCFIVITNYLLPKLQINNSIFIKSYYVIVSTGKLYLNAYLFQKLITSTHSDSFIYVVTSNFFTIIIATTVIIGCVNFLNSKGTKSKNLIKFGLAIILYNSVASMFTIAINLISSINVMQYPGQPNSETSYYIQYFFLVLISTAFIWFVIYFNKLLKLTTSANNLPTYTDSSIFNSTEDIIEANQQTTTGYRFLNYLIDYFTITMFAVNIITYLSYRRFLGININFNDGTYGFVFVSYFLSILYYTLQEKLLGYTIGKALTNTKVINEYGEIISWGQAFGRSFSRLVPFEAFSGFSTYMWHDSWTNTFVVDNNEGKQKADITDIHTFK